MLSFGKSSSGRKGLVRRRKFDTLIQAGPRMSEGSYSFNDLANVRSLTVSIAYPKPGDDIEAIMIERDFSDFDLGFDDDLDCVRVRHTLRENREINAWFNKQQKIKALQEKFWRFDRTEIEAMVKDEQRDKPKPDLRGHLFLESNPDGEEKVARKKKKQARIYSTRNYVMREKNAQSWKSVGNRQIGKWTPDNELTPNSGKFVPIGGMRFTAQKSWATKKPKIHVSWTIGEETSATYLQWKREDEEWQRECEELIAREFDRDDEGEDAIYFMEVDAFGELEELYRCGRWNHNEVDPETEVMGWDDDLWFLDEDLDMKLDEAA